ncbi:MAG: hypothetical protein SF028_12950 [Candidatus Sumerlaeia bacterium]|nr:hypothetical protein [Candidatus Sumerlaeia bacterium]
MKPDTELTVALERRAWRVRRTVGLVGATALLALLLSLAYFGSRRLAQPVIAFEQASSDRFGILRIPVAQGIELLLAQSGSEAGSAEAAALRGELRRIAPLVSGGIEVAVSHQPDGTAQWAAFVPTAVAPQALEKAAAELLGGEGAFTPCGAAKAGRLGCYETTTGGFLLLSAPDTPRPRLIEYPTNHEPDASPAITYEGPVALATPPLRLLAVAEFRAPLEARLLARWEPIRPGKAPAGTIRVSPGPDRAVAFEGVWPLPGPSAPPAE